MVQDEKNVEKETGIKDIPPVIEEKYQQTQHTITVNGKNLEYTATAGTIVLKDPDVDQGEKAKASIFYVAYTLNNVADTAVRPLTFSFNGGPGSSSVWLHLGALGPRRVRMDEEGMALPPPYRLVDNEYTLLESTDLVFIDPVSTGYSRSVPKEKPEQFHSVKKDIESVGDFIRLWTTRNQRWGSPKFLIGESYGTTRAAGLAGYLQDRRGFYLNGIMLVSSILNFLTTEFDPGNDLPYILYLPSYCATAWFHNKLDDKQQKSLSQLLEEAQKFAYGEYLLALMKGSQLQEEERIQIARKLARYTGLSEEYIRRSNLRVEINRFCKELRRMDGTTIGRFDSRLTGFDRDSAGEFPEIDPSYAAVLGPYTAAMYDYLRRDLSFEIDQPYEILSSIHETWNYDTFQNKYVNTAEELRKAFILNPYLKVMVCSGYYDLATPYLASEYTFEHLEIPDHLRNNIRMAYYEAGHMMYLHKASLVKLTGDLCQFIADAVG